MKDFIEEIEKAIDEAMIDFPLFIKITDLEDKKIENGISMLKYSIIEKIISNKQISNKIYDKVPF